MAELLGVGIDNPAVFVAVNVVVWVGAFALAAVLTGGSPTDALVPGAIGGLSFGVASWYLRERY